MRVLIVSSPGIGHVFPMVSLAWAVRAAGHDVLVATTGQALAAADAGLHTVDIAPGFSFETNMRDAAARHPHLMALARGGLTDPRQVVELFGVVTRPLVPAVLAAAERWRPDLIVHSPTDGGALLAAARLGVPVVHHGFGFFSAGPVAQAMRENMADVYAEHGLTSGATRSVTLDVAPPSMLAEPDDFGWAMRYVPYNGGGVLPDWLAQDTGGRPRIAVTLGTVAPRVTGLGPVERLLAVAPRVDAEFVLALGGADLSGFGELPANVHAVDWIPLGPLASTCAAVIHHGGAGTTLTVLDAGVPQLVLPSGADRHINARAVAARGAGLAATDEDLDVALVEQLLGDDKLRTAAQEVRAEMAAMPAPATLVPRLVELAG
ncbi:nucleotide disphospho-sugar-binding domain-containing protein [Goodfellowiella coeruleoviolacea]|uniref:UDP:flavonoid glycosyltransferase YjiC, YdhE family n=1 Tax=Goodfellowiella coeruleoviolacea TaxID=334858 RepID=A0AAE3GCR2_9PSEU|nr:nucleotide disphospho-sugar-binding domain-containing protein [Goodfellowiella coeruleoviolacea]MCP2164994.1 UDP:flavonoid glycosyltransferase YjiC, YdhE family [Goodfellowiella coeruleoviolacea]